MHMSTLSALLTPTLGAEASAHLLTTLTIHPALLGTHERIPRAVLAEALNLLLFADLVRRVPAAQVYVAQCVARGDTITHDHGAVRTVDLAGMGALPRGREALTRILTPLGYELHGTYPLDRLKMTGRSYAQADFPEHIAQFFISELHVDRFTEPFAQAVQSVTGESRDPLTEEAAELLNQLAEDGHLALDEAQALLPALAACFERQHPDPELADYEVLLAHSAEMAWIATEGNAFNHATDRVRDVEQLTREQKALGQPMKDKVEVSGSGRVRQTAFTAARVPRTFRLPDRQTTTREVPGSFLEFIARDFLPNEQTLDLAFDPSNAQAIFKMTT